MSEINYIGLTFHRDLTIVYHVIFGDESYNQQILAIAIYFSDKLCTIVQIFGPPLYDELVTSPENHLVFMLLFLKGSTTIQG